MIEWIGSLAGWDRRLPAAFILTNVTREQRRNLPQALAAAALGHDPDSVIIEQAKGCPPMVTRPAGSRLFLSVASRSPFTAAAIAASPIGIDVELVDAEGEVPWNVLHPRERALLADLGRESRAAGFARLWSLKEAYLKALGVGLSREPSSFAVRFNEGQGAAFDDPIGGEEVTEAETVWRCLGQIHAAVSTVVLGRGRGTGPLGLLNPDLVRGALGPSPQQVPGNDDEDRAD